MCITVRKCRRFIVPEKLNKLMTLHRHLQVKYYTIGFGWVNDAK